MRFSYKIAFETEDEKVANTMIGHMQVAYAEAWRLAKAHGRVEAIEEKIEKDGVIQWEIE
jgi:hypothetical protein